MFKDKKITVLEEENNRLKAEVNSLTIMIESLKNKIQNDKKVVDAALGYKEAHEKELALLNEAKQRYDEATRLVIQEKQRMKNEFEMFIKSI